MPEKCLRCGSDKLIPGLPLMDHYGDAGFRADQANVEVKGAPEAWIFTDSTSGHLSVHVCGECGHAELQVSDFRDLYAKYQKSRDG